MVDEVKFITIEGVELCSTGFWQFSSGPRWLEQKHLEAAVEAQDDPALKTPIIKIGHTDPRFDGNPLFGTIVNLRLSENNQTLLGDYVIAASLAPMVAKAPDDSGDPPYPDRSIEGWFDQKTASGKEYAFVLTAVALLGEQAPAIEDLEDIVGIFTSEDAFVAAANAGTREQGNKMLLAGTTVDKIRFGIRDEIAADDMPWGDWFWVRHLEVDDGSTGFCIVEDEDTAQLYRVPWTVSGDEITYGEITEVIEQYVAASKDTAEKSIAFAREIHESRGQPVTLTATAKGSTAQNPDATGELMDSAQLRESLGLTEDADEAAVEAALTSLKEKADTADTLASEKEELEEKVAASKNQNLPEGTVAIDSEQLEELKAQAADGAAARKKQREDERDAFIGEAIKAGKFPPARRDHYTSLYDADPEGTKEFIETLAAGAIPVEERGHSESGEQTDADRASYPESWLTASEKERVKAAREGGGVRHG